jgi:hypothetical protein
MLILQSELVALRNKPKPRVPSKTRVHRRRVRYEGKIYSSVSELAIHLEQSVQYVYRVAMSTKPKHNFIKLVKTKIKS